MVTRTQPTTTTSVSDDGRQTLLTTLEEELEALEQRFVGHDDDELMMSLKQLVRDHLTRPSQTAP